MDYYERLGVSRNASPDEIKRAYKKLAIKHHPDKGGDHETFASINEAYDTLKDPTKKQNYDNPQPQGFGPNGFEGMGGFEDLFSQFGFRPQRQQQNNDIVISYTLDFKDIFTGKGVNINYNLPSGKPGYLDAAIPPGVNHGSNVRYAGLGDDSIPHLAPGNLILKIRVRPHPVWKREANNIFSVKELDIFDFIVGTTVEIITPIDRKFSLNVPKGTKPGTVFSITGHGIPDVHSGRPGNVHIKLEAKMPILDQPTIDKIKEIKNGIS
jgi:DnaJ-class molecular chaperone